MGARLTGKESASAGAHGAVNALAGLVVHHRRLDHCWLGLWYSTCYSEGSVQVRVEAFTAQGRETGGKHTARQDRNASTCPPAHLVDKVRGLLVCEEIFEEKRPRLP